MKQAFTLIELLVYMAIMSFVIVVAGRVFSDSSAMRIRSQNMIKSSEEVGKLANLISEDVSQMGAKAYGTSASDYKVEVKSSVYMDPTTATPDSSSYFLKKNSYGLSSSSDSLAFRKIAMGQNGAYSGVRQISWYVKRDTDSLFRKCRTVDGTQTTECPSAAIGDSIFMGKVSKLQFFPSKPGLVGSSSAADTLFPTSVLSEFSLQGKLNGTGNELTFGNGDVNGIPKNQNSTDKEYLVLCLASKTGSCINFTFEEGETYVIEFKMPYDETDLNNTAQFLPGEDHLAVGLRNSSNYSEIDGAPPDVLIFPSQASERTDGLKHIEISTGKEISASVAITLALYSEKAYSGTFRFKDFKVFRKNDEAFYFPREDYGTTNLTEKKKAKAFELVLEVDNRGEKAGTKSKDGSGIVILTPNNGISAIGSGI